MFAVRVVKWAFSVIARLAIFGVFLIGLFLVSLRLEHGFETTLPAPTGAFAVARTTYQWIDDTQMDNLAPLPETKREIVAWIWYPSAKGQPVTETNDYLPEPWRMAVESYRGTLITKFLERDISLVRAHGIRNAKFPPSPKEYPVVIMRAGLSALTTEYTTLAEDLASHGYVVVGFDAPYRTQVVVLSDGQAVYRTPRNDPEVVGGQDGERIAQD